MHKFGFTPQLRLVDSNQVRQVCRRGKKLSSSTVTVFFSSNQLTHPRLCVSIGKKQVKKAWQRNCIKRVARESFRLQQYQLPNVDIVLVVWKAMSALDKLQIRQVIDTQWQKLLNYAKPA